MCVCVCVCVCQKTKLLLSRHRMHDPLWPQTSWKGKTKKIKVNNWSIQISSYKLKIKYIKGNKMS